ncbi:hypothetical protein NQ318_021990 [Aromia moschata]|uniref:Glucose-methanol-choline oxidoreductase N-terminal domain-containing protein n=1 Tax=Aromia moschata TaxID=1265417 RepID=A0AAV8Z722_9CUCU|nr:hypothetical protein NQ318_021990 [Aromia moschata]
MNLPLQFSKYNWGFVSTPQKTSCLGMEGRRCPMSRGKGIGGSTLINGLVYSRASSIDFDKWAKHVNDSRWSYPEVEHYFQKSEEFLHRDKKAPADDFAHGNSGELHVEYHLPRSLQLDAFLEANEELGLPIADYNAGIGLGASPSQLNTKFGRRVDGGKAFVQPILHRRNIKVLPNSYVTKILIDEHNVAYGIYFTHHGQKYVATVEKEVIVSAGSISTPHLLMLSGIGPRDHLRSKHIPLVQDLEVGSKLRDHPCFYGLNFETNYAEPVDTLTGYIKDYIKGVGPMTVPGNNQGVGFYESQFTKGTGYPDIEIMFIPANATSDLSQRAFRLTNQTYEDVWGRADRTRTYVMYVIALHAESTGTVRLRSKDPFDYPLIDTSFLSDPEDHDIELIYEGVQLALRLSDTDALQRLDATLQGGPLRACRHFKYPSRKYWYCAIRQLTMDVFHPVGTCPMGPYPDEGDVVDSKLRVHGVKNLRVADASVFPFTLAGHTSAVVVMVGEAASDILKEHWL